VQKVVQDPRILVRLRAQNKGAILHLIGPIEPSEFAVIHEPRINEIIAKEEIVVKGLAYVLEFVFDREDIRACDCLTESGKSDSCNYRELPHGRLLQKWGLLETRHSLVFKDRNLVIASYGRVAY